VRLLVGERRFSGRSSAVFAALSAVFAALSAVFAALSAVFAALSAVLARVFWCVSGLIRPSRSEMRGRAPQKPALTVPIQVCRAGIRVCSETESGPRRVKQVLRTSKSDRLR
jgi:hypothetical protein